MTLPCSPTTSRLYWYTGLQPPPSLPSSGQHVKHWFSSWHCVCMCVCVCVCVRARACRRAEVAVVAGHTRRCFDVHSSCFAVHTFKLSCPLLMLCYKYPCKGSHSLATLSFICRPVHPTHLVVVSHIRVACVWGDTCWGTSESRCWW